MSAVGRDRTEHIIRPLMTAACAFPHQSQFSWQPPVLRDAFSACSGRWNINGMRHRFAWAQRHQRGDTPPFLLLLATLEQPEDSVPLPSDGSMCLAREPDSLSP